LHQPFNYAITPSGGTPPYANVAVISGSLPNGIALTNTSGLLGGVPTVAGVFSFTYRVADSQGQSSLAAAQVTVSLPNTVDSDIPTLPEWGVMVLATVLLAATYYRNRQLRRA
jgi:hypothetical protein